jgi:putative membrane protein
MLRKFLKIKLKFLRNIPPRKKQSQEQLQQTSNSLRSKYHLYRGKLPNRLQVILQPLSSLLPSVVPWSIFFAIYGFLVSLLFHLGFSVALSENANILTKVIWSFNIILTLLLVFRTNTAHERFWEGRKLWGALVNTVRNLARDIWIIVKESSHSDQQNKEATLLLIAAFAISMKLHLRGQPVNEELELLMNDSQYLQLQQVKHPPLQIAFWIGDYLQQQHDSNCLDIYQLTDLNRQVSELVNILGGCERILKTPLPLIYGIILRMLVFVYCIVLPLELVDNVYWWTGAINAFIGFSLLSIEHVGGEIEEPFGSDSNDLPLNVICNTILMNVQEMISFTPKSARHIKPRTMI